MPIAIALLVLLGAIPAFAGPGASAPASTWVTGAAVPAGPLTTQALAFSVAAYLPTTGVDGDKVLEDLQASEFRDWFVATKRSAPSTDLVTGAFAASIHLPLAAHPVPTGELLEFLGRGLSADARRTLNAAGRIHMITLVPRSSELGKIKRACQLVGAFAKATGAILQDESTGQFFDAAGWKKHFMDSWKENVPDVPEMIVIHSVAEGGQLHLDTMGLARFGLPELIAPPLPEAAQRQASLLVNTIAQQLVEAPVLAAPGRVALNNGAVTVQLRVARGHHRERSIAISFVTAAGEDEARALNATMGKLVGPAAQLSRAPEGDEELESARKRAQLRLAQLGEIWRRGPPPGGSLVVKSGFPTESGSLEWMWVKAQSWSGDKITGVLINQPEDVPTLGIGVVVTIDATTLFDYVYQEAGKPEEGGETNRIFERRSQGQ